MSDDGQTQECRIFPAAVPRSLVTGEQTLLTKKCAFLTRIKDTLRRVFPPEAFAPVKIRLAPDPRLVRAAHLGFHRVDPAEVPLLCDPDAGTGRP